MRIGIFFLALIFSFTSFAQTKNSLRELSLNDSQSWSDFQKAILEQERDSEKVGTGYLISGALIVLGGMVGYHNARTPIEKLAFSVTQSLGVAGIGYGAYLHYVGSPEQLFYQSVESSASLSLENKNELARNYMMNWQARRENEKWLRVISHSLVAAVNIFNGSKEEGELRQGLMTLGGVNLLAAISFSFQ